MENVHLIHTVGNSRLSETYRRKMSNAQGVASLVKTIAATSTKAGKSAGDGSHGGR